MIQSSGPAFTKAASFFLLPFISSPRSTQEQRSPADRVLSEQEELVNGDVIKSLSFNRRGDQQTDRTSLFCPHLRAEPKLQADG